MSDPAYKFMAVIQWDNGDELGEEDSDLFRTREEARTWTEKRLGELKGIGLIHVGYIYEGTMYNFGDPDDLSDWSFEANPTIETEVIHP